MVSLLLLNNQTKWGNTMKIKYFEIKIIAFILIMAINLAFPQQVGVTTFQFLKVTPDARTTAMGDALASVSNSSASAFGNPAALAFIPKIDISFSHVDWFFDSNISGAAAAFPLANIGTIGIHSAYVDFGDVIETTVDQLGFVGGEYHPGLTGRTINPSSMVFGVTFARSLTDKFSFGLTTKYAHEDLVASSASSIVFDFGLRYNSHFRSINLSAVVRNFGPEVKFEEEKFPLPQALIIGVSSKLLSPDGSFFMNSDKHELYIACDMAQPRDYDQQYHLGFEYSFMNLMFLRAGYKFNFDEEGLCFGGGVKFKVFKVDYSYSEFGDYLDNIHRFSLGLAMN